MPCAARRLFQSQPSAAENFRNKLRITILKYIVRAFVFTCNQAKVTDATHHPEVSDG